MIQNILVKPIATQKFSLNMPGVDDLFPGFEPGDFAVLYGSPSIISITSLLSVKAQLPTQFGGLSSKVIFIDGGNTFKLHNIARLAQLHQLNPKETLERIYISRAFTAYQLTSLLMEKLEETVKTYKPKLVIISDIARLFLDNDIPTEEAERVYSQIISYLSNFAKKHQIILLATYLPYDNNKRNTSLQNLTFARTNIVLCFTKTKYTKEVALEKHPRFVLGVAELPSENITLMNFMAPKLC